MRRSVRGGVVVVVVALGLAPLAGGCGGDDTGAPSGDGGGADASMADSMVAPESGHDAEMADSTMPQESGTMDAAETGAESGPEGGMDAGQETGSDAGPGDGGLDAEAAAEASSDAGPDGTVDGAVDGAAEAGSDASSLTCDAGTTCHAATDCPLPPNACFVATCGANACCGTGYAAAGTPCAFNSGTDCNGNGLCVTHCFDTVVDGDETDVDCGGLTCPACSLTKHCARNADCASLGCNPSTHVCVTPTCSDGFTDGHETDVDCGGPDCMTTCAHGKHCLLNSDCASGLCLSMTCQ